MLRVIDSMQLTAANKLATPANWEVSIISFLFIFYFFYLKKIFLTIMHQSVMLTDAI